MSKPYILGDLWQLAQDEVQWNNENNTEAFIDIAKLLESEYPEYFLQLVNQYNALQEKTLGSHFLGSQMNLNDMYKSIGLQYVYDIKSQDHQERMRQHQMSQYYANRPWYTSFGDILQSPLVMMSQQASGVPYKTVYGTYETPTQEQKDAAKSALAIQGAVTAATLTGGFAAPYFAPGTIGGNFIGDMALWEGFNLGAEALTGYDFGSGLRAGIGTIPGVNKFVYSNPYVSDAYTLLTDIAANPMSYGAFRRPFINGISKATNIDYATYLRKNFNKVLSKRKPSIATDDITYAFNSNPELAKIGTIGDYRNYLTTIFPNSKYRGIVWHGGPRGILQLQFGHNPNINTGTQDYGIYLTTDKRLAQYYANTNKNGIVYPAMVNLENAARFDRPNWYLQKMSGTHDLSFTPSSVTKYWYDRLGLNRYNGIWQGKSSNALERNQLTIFNPEDTHILGGSKDVDMFRAWKELPYTLLHPEFNFESLPNIDRVYNVTPKTVLKAAVPGIVIGGVTGGITGAGVYNYMDIQKNKKDAENDELKIE